MRVCVIATSWPRAAGDPSGHFVKTEAIELARAGHEVTVLAPDAPPDGLLKVIPLSGGSAFGWPGALTRLRQNPLAIPSAASWIRRAREAVTAAGPFDRVVAHWAVPCAWPIARHAQGTLEVVSHGSDVKVLARMPRRIVRAIAERARPWRFVSSALLERFLASLPAQEALLVASVATVRPCSIEIPDVHETIRTKREQVGVPFVTSIGRLVAQKRTDRVIEVAARERVPLVIVGDGPERARLERMSRGARVHFVGRVPRQEALAWLSASESLWFAAREEGFPTVVREAEALGIPVRVI